MLALEEVVAISTVQSGPYWWPMKGLGGKRRVVQGVSSRSPSEWDPAHESPRANVAVGEENLMTSRDAREILRVQLAKDGCTGKCRLQRKKRETKVRRARCSEGKSKEMQRNVTQRLEREMRGERHEVQWQRRRKEKGKNTSFLKSGVVRARRRLGGKIKGVTAAAGQTLSDAWALWFFLSFSGLLFFRRGRIRGAERRRDKGNTKDGKEKRRWK